MATELVDPMASVRAYLAAEKSSNTRRSYVSDWTDFTRWCLEANEAALPADPISVAKYLARLADRGLKASTIERRVAAIRYAHKTAGHEPPTNAEGVKAVMRGIRRQVGRRQVRKAPVTAIVLEQLAPHFAPGLVGLRDRALVMIGFAAALRRSELVALQVSEVSMRSRGIVLHIGRSKTDQDGKGAEIPVPRGGKLRPVAALEAWLKAAALTEGPIFREVDRHGNVGQAALSDRSVARIIKKLCAAAGLDASLFAGHSLRAGFVTSALDNDVDDFKIMRITRHKKVDTLRIYDRRENGFEDHAGEEFL
jgi:site-specific recombinase XerD